MRGLIGKREFLTAGLGLAAGLGLTGVGASAQPAPAGVNADGDARQSLKIPHRVAKTTLLFKGPTGFPNALAVMTDAPGGLWIGEQKVSGARLTAQYGVPEPKDLNEAAWLVDWNGKLLKTIMTPSRNTSGIAYGDGCIWMGANRAPFGIFQINMAGEVVSHRQIPLAGAGDGGGCHGLMYQDGKLWISALRLRGILRVDPKTWEPEVLIPIDLPETPRLHATAWDKGSIWLVTGTDSKSWAESGPGLARYDATTGDLLETVSFAPKSADPHGLVMHDGVLYSCDSGIHPRWKGGESPTTGYVFRIDFI